MSPHCGGSPGVRGQALTEYLVVLAVLVLVLLMPIEGPQAGGRCAAVWLADSLRALYGSLAFFLSLP